MTKEFEILPTTAEEWFDKYQTLLEEIDKKEDELAHLSHVSGVGTHLPISYWFIA